MGISWKAFGQADSSKWSIDGYIKDLRTIIFQRGSEGLLIDNLLHNRINIDFLPSKQWTFTAELRNRLFYGQAVQQIPNYADLIETNDYLDLSKVWLDESSVVGHSVLDRAYIDYHTSKWDITLGRQRVNWGINTVWNPNDLFNAFSYVDFDYEERPGSDALRIQRYLGFASRAELALKAADNLDESVIAGLYRFNKWNYDIQFLGGIDQGDATLGMGWAGNIKTAGFKGEATYFHPYKTLDSAAGDLSVSFALDYSFPNSTYVMFSGLYNTTGTDKSTANFFSFNPSAKALSPYKYNLFTSVMYPFTPLLSGNMAIIYAPGPQATFINPGLSLSIATNWDLDLIGQLFLQEDNNIYVTEAQLIFIRLKWSY